MTLEQLRAKATTFDVWKVPDMGEYRELVTLNWLRQGSDRFKLSYPWQEGTEILEVAPNLLGKFDISATFREAILGLGGKYDIQIRQRTLAKDLPSAADALKAAETFVNQERRQIARLRDRDAAWRTRPATTKQLDMLRRMRVPIPAGALTAGRASDLIDLAKNRRR